MTTLLALTLFVSALEPLSFSPVGVTLHARPGTPSLVGYDAERGVLHAGDRSVSSATPLPGVARCDDGRLIVSHRHAPMLTVMDGEEREEVPLPHTALAPAARWPADGCRLAVRLVNGDLALLDLATRTVALHADVFPRVADPLETRATATLLVTTGGELVAPTASGFIVVDGALARREVGLDAPPVPPLVEAGGAVWWVDAEGGLGRWSPGAAPSVVARGVAATTGLTAMPSAAGVLLLWGDRLGQLHTASLDGDHQVSPSFGRAWWRAPLVVDANDDGALDVVVVTEEGAVLLGHGPHPVAEWQRYALQQAPTGPAVVTATADNAPALVVGALGGNGQLLRLGQASARPVGALGAALGVTERDAVASSVSEQARPEDVTAADEDDRLGTPAQPLEVFGCSNLGPSAGSPLAVFLLVGAARRRRRRKEISHADACPSPAPCSRRGGNPTRAHQACSCHP